MRINIAELILKIMHDSGLSELVDTELDDHSVITFNMKDKLPPIHIINNEDDEVWIWTTLGEFSFNSLNYYSLKLLPLMLTYNEDIFILGQPCLYLDNNVLTLRAMIKECNLLSTEKFIDCLSAFLVVVQEYISVLI
ncbi:TPA: hypothetical protein ACOP2N_004579 [Salmonella enterica]|nr:hypothetical protein [Salmonella enterica]EBZ4888373.1 hypothetical protein [Salmonella enterica subsp. enterica serovar Bredeney]EDT6893117.1 hypothetical protein [Salmonella enterica subsp. enterica serovar Javiana]EDX5193489.1 hypothetical protein [Salmonella enterica subsp. enterica serovar Glostrup]EHW1129035.1 hypothetical protein [Salmonella enterica subsp. enterica serovar Kinondoni]MIY24075.1 hypothetical protein [Salmonella enterica subsp. enterica]HCM6292663.1 hypothetical prote